MIRRRFTRTNRWILDQNIILTRHLLQLVKQGGGFGRILEYWLMLPDPFLAFRPDISFFDVKRLLSQGRFTRGQLCVNATYGAENPAQHQKIQQHKNRASDYP